MFIQQGGFLQIGTVTQGIQARALQDRRRICQLVRHIFAFAHDFTLDVRQRGLSERESAVQGFFHAHVKPGFDGIHQKLYRDAIHHCTGDKCHQADDEKKTRRQLGAKHARANPPNEQGGLKKDQADQTDGCNRRDDQQQGQVFCEEFGVASRCHKQANEDGPHQQAGGN